MIEIPRFHKLFPCVGLRGIACALGLLLCSAEAREVRILGGVWQYRFGDEPAEMVQLPHSWNTHDAAEGAQGRRDDAKSVNSLVYKRGAATYTRQLRLDKDPGKRYFLRCGGASIVSELIVNGKSAGRHEGAFTAFCHEITDLLRQGDNTISLRVDNTHRDHIAPQRGDFSMFGGLYREVELMETDALCIDPLYYASPGVFIRTQSLEEERAVIEVKTLLNSTMAEAREVTLCVVVRDAEGREVASRTKGISLAAGEARREEVLELEIPHPILWNGVENPYLYTVQVGLKTAEGQIDTLVQPLGLRTASIDPQRGFVLNGKAMQLRGVSRHQDRHGRGWALSAEDEEQDVRLIVDMGATALRTAHYPQSTHIYELCDQAGLVVWSEVPNVNLVRDTPEFRANNQQQALEMIYQNWNHPSICMWGIFNEIYHQPEPVQQQVNQEAELETLRDFVKAADPHRLVVAASNQPGRQKLNRIPDHIAFNTYPGWYGGGPEVMAGNLAGFIRNHAGKGVGVSEYGHGASIHMHENPVMRPKPSAFWHPEEWQSHAHEVNYRCICQEPQIWGAFIWNMFDFASSNRCEGDSPGINDKGLVTYDRQVCKDAYYFYKANWNPELMVYITSRRFAERRCSEVPVKVYSNADSVELFVNGQSCGSVKPDGQGRAIWPSVQLEPGQNLLSAIAKRGSAACSDSCTWLLRANSPTPQPREQYMADGIRKR